MKPLLWLLPKIRREVALIVHDYKEEGALFVSTAILTMLSDEKNVLKKFNCSENNPLVRGMATLCHNRDVFINELVEPYDAAYIARLLQERQANLAGRDNPVSAIARAVVPQQQKPTVHLCATHPAAKKQRQSFFNWLVTRIKGQ